jgi:hypothetical protein
MKRAIIDKLHKTLEEVSGFITRQVQRLSAE